MSVDLAALKGPVLDLLARVSGGHGGEVHGPPAAPQGGQVFQQTVTDNFGNTASAAATGGAFAFAQAGGAVATAGVGFGAAAGAAAGGQAAGGGDLFAKVQSAIADLQKLLGGMSGAQQKDLGQKAAGCCCHGGGAVGQPQPQGGGLNTSAGSSTVTTAGGYKIEATGATEFKITGPDGKSTKVHGDPHVAESDGGKWDFKKDSKFVLPDGTQINVKTKEAGNNTTIASALEITNGGQRAVMEGIDKGKGKVTTLDNNPAQFQTQQTFTMGSQTDDWSINGKEIIGDNGADNFKLGNALPAGGPAAEAGAAAGGAAPAGGAQPAAGGQQAPAAGGAAPAGGAQPAAGAGQAQAGGLEGIVSKLLEVVQSLIQSLGGNKGGAQPAAGAPAAAAPAQAAPAQAAPAQAQQKDPLGEALRSIGQMLTAVADVLKLTQGGGGRQIAA